MPFIVVEFMSRGSLEHLLRDAAVDLPFAKRLQFLHDCAQGMQFLHECNPPLVHRDLKSGNLLVDDNWVVKVADFGTAKKRQGRTVRPTPTTSLRASVIRPGHGTVMVDDDTAFTLMWAAPEGPSSVSPTTDLSTSTALALSGGRCSRGRAPMRSWR